MIRSEDLEIDLIFKGYECIIKKLEKLTRLNFQNQELGYVHSHLYPSKKNR